MRTITVSTQAGINQQVTKPRYLVKLGFSTEQRHSTREQLVWDGALWLSTGVRVDSLDAESARVSLPNDDLANGAIVLSEGVKDKPIQIWQLYGDGPWQPADAVELFSGVLTRYQIQGLRVGLEASANALSKASSPRTRIMPPLCNHLVPPGTRIDNVILEPRY